VYTGVNSFQLSNQESDRMTAAINHSRIRTLKHSYTGVNSFQLSNQESDRMTAAINHSRIRTLKHSIEIIHKRDGLKKHVLKIKYLWWKKSVFISSIQLILRGLNKISGKLFNVSILARVTFCKNLQNFLNSEYIFEFLNHKNNLVNNW